ncbi:hypothetical protein [Staphylococcus argenteus]|uniref:hypothetical protein n=1 Tax=Staphylococcus argenteus TaxID=985002 RepID=UPI0002340058|nr:hypothetical protein [Staphylococcus argenteus]API78439.1 hypothetical protein A7971_01635 [Staphylococcus argenteus]MBE2124820.1 hypothetical protein [Staphylococcus argenteus]MBE2132269.1 hypothetical protein [Staphylococcus argenteus]MBE2132699.1 hypothetical protein [Staphylococcus argenteus]MBE2136024.1 hypothetical protein [Staphylococcus argenteus]
MEFKTIQSVKDPHYNEALQLYDTKLNLSLTEDKRMIKHSLENNKTENDYVFIVGLENDAVVSLATAHYEATTNAAFLIYLFAKDLPNHDELMTQTLHQIEHELNVLSNIVHSRDINFLMMEVPKEPADLTKENGLIIEHRRQFLYEHQFERQTEIDYIHPSNDGHAKKVDLFLKKNIKLTKDIYGTSVKSNYILKYVFANGISRDIIYALLEEMDLRKPF